MHTPWNLIVWFNLDHYIKRLTIDCKGSVFRNCPWGCSLDRKMPDKWNRKPYTKLHAPAPSLVLWKPYNEIENLFSFYLDHCIKKLTIDYNNSVSRNCPWACNKYTHACVHIWVWLCIFNKSIFCVSYNHGLQRYHISLRHSIKKFTCLAYDLTFCMHPALSHLVDDGL